MTLVNSVTNLMMTDEEKLLAGARLFDMACRVTLDGIRHERPELTDPELLEVLRSRLRLARKLEQRQVEREGRT